MIEVAVNIPVVTPFDGSWLKKSMPRKWNDWWENTTSEANTDTFMLSMARPCAATGSGTPGK
jgi:hypothetical protein